MPGVEIRRRGEVIEARVEMRHEGDRQHSFVLTQSGGYDAIWTLVEHATGRQPSTQRRQRAANPQDIQATEPVGSTIADGTRLGYGGSGKAAQDEYGQRQPSPS